MAPDTMRVRLHLRLIRVVTVLVDAVDRLEVVVVLPVLRVHNQNCS